ncbi:erythromycin esterase family protein [Halomarina pelagica]|uniref:erythromycin esterase family protein n=1 Tax=Halomarina pelagica TaxID=2961599 RepID=UPI003F602C72
MLSDDLAAGTPLADERGHRAIGVVYHPNREAANYVPTVLPERYDAFVHADETRAPPASPPRDARDGTRTLPDGALIVSPVSRRTVSRAVRSAPPPRTPDRYAVETVTITRKFITRPTKAQFVGGER